MEPAKLIDLPTVEGQELVKQSQDEGLNHLDTIGAKFGKQINRRFCGVQSICIVLNALGIKPPNNTTAFLEGDFWEYGMSRAVEKEEVDKQGMTLEQCAALLGGVAGVTVTHYRTSQVDQQEFRKEVEAAMKSDNSEVIVNYHMGALGRGSLGGHFSPLGGYSAARDMALVMDVWHCVRWSAGPLSTTCGSPWTWRIGQIILPPRWDSLSSPGTELLPSMNLLSSKGLNFYQALNNASLLILVRVRASGERLQSNG